MKKSIKKIVFAIIGLFISTLLSTLFTGEVSASQIYIHVTPARFDYELNPGDVKTGKFTVYNEGSKDWSYEVAAKPYDARTDDDGALNVSYDAKSTYSQITNWVKFDKEKGVLKSKDFMEINFTITVPKDAPGGGQYAVLFVSASNPENGLEKNTHIGEIASIGPIVYTRVNGDIREEGKVLSVDMDTIMSEPPISLRSTVENTGNVHAFAEYTMKIYPLFGNETIYNNEEDPKKVTILPESKRYYIHSWKAEEGAPNVGIYRAEAEVKIYDKVEKISKIILICPVWVALSVIIFIIALIYWFASRAASRRERKKNEFTAIDIPERDEK